MEKSGKYVSTRRNRKLGHDPADRAAMVAAVQYVLRLAGLFVLSLHSAGTGELEA